MINKTNIDVQIYLDSLMEGINQMGMLDSLSEEFGIDKEDLMDSLIENLSIQASVNFEESGDPKLDQSQFEDIVHRSAVECTVEDMVKDGILIKNLEEGGVENTYMINPKVKKLIDEENDDEEE